LLGRLEEAATRGREGLELALRLADPFSLAWAYHAAGVSQQLFGDWSGSEGSSAEAARLAEEHGFPHVLGMATANQGWALLMQGKTAIGVSTLRDGVAAVEATGAALVRPQYLGMLAAADAIEGDREGAERRFDEAIAEVERTGERVHEVGLLIGKSHLLVAGGGAERPARGAAEAAESSLAQALEVARAQGARLLELRAAVALARHWRKRGRGAEGRTLLVAAHDFFGDARPVAPEIVAARRLLAEPE
jgi:predicted ATPase